MLPPQQGNPPQSQQSYQTPKKGLGCLGWGAIIAGVVVLGCGGGVILIGKAVMDDPSVQKAMAEAKNEGTKPATAAESKTAPLYTAAEIAGAYKDNALAAEAKYQKGLIRVKGTVETVDRNFGKAYVIFKNPEMSLISVQAMFAESSEPELVKLKKGQSLTVLGKCEGQPAATNVVLEDCRIVR